MPSQSTANNPCGLAIIVGLPALPPFEIVPRHFAQRRVVCNEFPATSRRWSRRWRRQASDCFSAALKSFARFQIVRFNRQPIERSRNSIRPAIGAKPFDGSCGGSR
jgi:hypothetical protein